MHEISCPHCQKAFAVDETGYAELLKQVHTEEFDQELNKRMKLAEQDTQHRLDLSKSEANREMHEAVSVKEKEIQELSAKLASGDIAQKMAISEALKQVEKDRDVLKYDLDQLKRDMKAASELADTKHENAHSSMRCAIFHKLG